MRDELKRMNKGFMRKDGKFFLPITHESLVVDNDGTSLAEKYVNKAMLEGYATISYVDEAILKAQIGEEVDLSGYATIEQLAEKADKSEIPFVDVNKSYVDEQIAGHTHEEYATEDFVKEEIEKIDLSTSHVHLNKAILDTISLEKINEWDSKSDFSGSFKDLTDVPEFPDTTDMATQDFVIARVDEVRKEIPKVDVTKAYVDTELYKKADKGHKHSIANIIDMPEIPSIEGLASEQFVLDEIAKVQVGENVDLSEYAKLSDLESKADKSEIPSIEGLATEAYVDEKIANIVFPEYDDSEIKSRVEVLESIDHNAFLTEHQDISHLATKEELEKTNSELEERIEVLETINLETKPYIDKNGMLVLCGCPAIAKGVDDEVHVITRFFNDEEDKFVFTKEEFAKLRICMGYGAEGVGTKRAITETTLELYDIDKAFIIDGGSQITGEIGTVNIIAERVNYIDGIQGARAMNGGERNVVHNFNVKVKDVKLIDTLFGGGNGFSVVWNSNIEVDGDTTVNYLIAGGSNGYTNKSRVVLNGGHAKVMQGVNRGILNKAELIVNGGIVDNFYAAGEVDPAVTGVQYESYIELNGGQIVKFNKGISNSVEFAGEIKGHIMDCEVLEGDVSMLVKIEKEPEVKYATEEYVDEKIAAIEFPECDCKQYDDSELKGRVEALEAVDHDAFLTEHQDISHLAVAEEVDAALETKADKSDIPSINGLASEEFVQQEIAKIEIPECEKYDDTDLQTRVSALEAIEHILKPNFTYKINMIAPDKEAFVQSEGDYPNITLTFNIPMGTISAEEPENPEESGTPRMWVGYINYDETGKAGINDPDQISENMSQDTVMLAKSLGTLVEMDPQELDKYPIAFKNENGGYICCIYPKANNYTFYYQSSVSGDYIPFENLDDGVYQFKQIGTQLVNKINGVTYCQTGAFTEGDGVTRYFAVKEN